MHKLRHKIAHKLFPDSNHPLYPIPSNTYVCDDVFVIIAIYIEIIYMHEAYKTLNFNLLASLFLNVSMYINKFNIINE